MPRGARTTVPVSDASDCAEEELVLAEEEEFLVLLGRALLELLALAMEVLLALVLDRLAVLSPDAENTLDLFRVILSKF